MDIVLGPTVLLKREHGKSQTALRKGISFCDHKEVLKENTLPLILHPFLPLKKV